MLFLPLCAGARVVIADANATGDARELLAELKRSNASMMQATPGTWRMLLEAGWQGSHQLKVLCGGEEFPPDLAAKHLCCAVKLC